MNNSVTNKNEVTSVASSYDRVEHWKSKLLDLTKSNRMLNINADRSTKIKVEYNDYNTLLKKFNNGDKFKFLPKDDDTFDATKTQSDRTIIAKKHLQTEMDESSLEKSLLLLLRRFNTSIQESGFNTLYLVLGTLVWKEARQSNTCFEAPIIMLPVELTRISASSSIQVNLYNEEEAVLNATLVEYLKQYHEVELDEFQKNMPYEGDVINLKKIFSIIQDKTAEEHGFQVKHNILVSHFSFANYMMWNDLTERVSELNDNKFVNYLIHDPPVPYEQNNEFIENTEIDKKVSSSEVFTPLNADSSQISAIVASGKNQDFVIEGPPGTGKSETIANIIAHNIAINRTVLFVAEKSEALDVVHDRLKKINLETLVLELHSNKAKKGKVYEQLRRSWYKKVKGTDKWQKTAAKIEAIKPQLNDYVSDLHSSSVFGLVTHEVIGCAISTKKEHVIDLHWGQGFDKAPISNESSYYELIEFSQQLGIVFSSLDQELNGINLVRHTEWSNYWQSKLRQHATKFNNDIKEVTRLVNEFTERFDFPLPELTFATIHHYEKLAEYISIINPMKFKFVISDDSEKLMFLLQQISELKHIVEQSEYYREILDIVSYPIKDWLKKHNEVDNAIWPLSLIKKYYLQKEIEKYSIRNVIDLIAWKEQLKLKYIINEIRNFDVLVEEVKDFNITSTKIMELRRAWINDKENLYKSMAWSGNPNRLLLNLSKLLIHHEPDELKDNTLVTLAAAIVESIKHLKISHKEFNQLTKSATELYDMSMLSNKLHQLDISITGIKNWCRWLRVRDQAINLNLSSLVNALEERIIQPNESAKQLTKAINKWAAPQLIDTTETLKDFHTELHENAIRRFVSLDEELTRSTSNYILSEFRKKMELTSNALTTRGFRILKKELLKKKGFKPIKVMMSELNGTLLELTPCVMMSPLSAAQYLPNNFKLFDLVVFDEASQITVENSVGAISRGKNVVVVGDSKQLPPTSFFGKELTTLDHSLGNEDLESILDQAVLAGLPVRRLKGHYRSKHETLISFSNEKYYDNELITFPSPDTKESSVQFRRVQGIYDKGKSRQNIIEANEVVNEVVRRLMHPELSKLSLGVVTLSSAQQELIENQLEEFRRDNYEYEIFFRNVERKPLFIKNLESVQGDERDVILLSLGYGPDPVDNRMSMNFGPLNRIGGERRLNVAITRATTQMIVFSSFDPEMIVLNSKNAVGVRDLKDYLLYARDGPSTLTRVNENMAHNDKFESSLENEVAFELRKRGWVVHSQVGVNRFRIDLGIVHPDQPERYLAGVECDGATYHKLPSIRDRDRIRHVTLVKLGWKLIRLWSTDYYNDPIRAITRVHVQLENLLNADREVTLDCEKYDGIASDDSRDTSEME